MPGIEVTIDQDDYHTVHIESGFSLPCIINLSLSPEHAYILLQALQAQESRIKDLTTNYHQCDVCDKMHPNTIKECPTLDYWKDKEEDL